MDIIAHIENDYIEKFGIPRQSGLAEGVISEVVFEKEFSRTEAVKGLLDFSYIWLLWLFDVDEKDGFVPTVRPPRLGGNERVGVFASRSPFRPNHIGMSSVKLLEIKQRGNLVVLVVEGADLRNNTKIIDIKPYLEYSDSHVGAGNGFGADEKAHLLDVTFASGIADKLDDKQRNDLISVLKYDPRPSYKEDSDREYGMNFGKSNVKFVVNGNELTVTEISEIGRAGI